MTRIAVVGVGAIGGVAAAALAARDDHDIVHCVRRAYTEFAFDDQGQPSTIPVRAETDPAVVGVVDVVVLATKAFQLVDVAPWLERLCGPDTVVAALINGIEHRELVTPLIGPAQLAPTIVFIPASRRGPGHASLDGDIATLTVPDDAPGHVVAAAFTDTFVKVKPTEDFAAMAWTKLLSNSALGVVCTLARRNNEILHDPDAQALCHALMDEIMAVAAAEGVGLRPGIADAVLEGTLAFAATHQPSILVDRLAGQRSEWEVRNEVVVRLARRHGIDVPLNAAMTTLLRLGEPPAGKMDP